MKINKILFLGIAAICTSVIIYTAVFISTDFVRYLATLQKTTLHYATGAFLILVALFAIRAHTRKTK